MADLKSAPAKSKPAVAPLDLPAVSRAHLEAMSNEIGVWQHAIQSDPDPAHGFCTDDVARALVVDLLHARELGWAQVAGSVDRSVRFLEEAFVPSTGRFRNFRAANGDWLDSGGSEDSHARAMGGLAAVLAGADDPSLAARARRLFTQSVPAARSLTALRPMAAAILACEATFGAGHHGPTEDVHRILVARLAAAFDPVVSARDWPWPKPVLTYENAILPQALIVAARRVGDARLLDAGRLVLDWLLEEQTTMNGLFLPIGNGWWPKGGVRSQFDQQPIEATTTLLAAEAAFEATGEERYRGAARMAYGWFLGDNLLGIRVADPASGASCDGLTARGVNPNQGAESTLMWLTALEHMRHFGSRS